MPFYDTDGHEVHPDFIPFPDLCRTCRKNDDINRYIFCEMRRIKRQYDEVFECTGFVPILPEVEKEKL